MSRTILPYPVPTDREEFALDIPVNGEIKNVQTVHNEGVMYVDVEPEKNKTTRYFRVCGNYEPDIPATAEYLGTFQLDGGSSAFHLFEVIY